jgi:hypothetical protein
VDIRAHLPFHGRVAGNMALSGHDYLIQQMGECRERLLLTGVLTGFDLASAEASKQTDCSRWNPRPYTKRHAHGRRSAEEADREVCVTSGREIGGDQRPRRHV